MPARLVDEFDGASLNGSKWASLSTADLSMSGGRLAIACTPRYAGVRSLDRYSVRDISLQLELVQFPNSGGNNSAQVLLRVHDVPDVDHVIMVWSGGGSVELTSRTAGVSDTEWMMWDSSARWWRLREESGRTFFESSTDGAVWNTWRAVDTPAWMDSAYINVQCGHWQAETDPGTAIIERIALGRSARKLGNDRRAGLRILGDF